MNVIEFPNPSLHNIPAMLRNIADDIDAGEFGHLRAGVMVLESDTDLFNFGWDDAEGFKAVGLFYAGAQMLVAGE
jgi:hypothetical protein